MSMELQIFNHPEFGGVRVIGDADNPQFCSSDVCKTLDFTVKGVMQRLDKTGYEKSRARSRNIRFIITKDGKDNGKHFMANMLNGSQMVFNFSAFFLVKSGNSRVRCAATVAASQMQLGIRQCQEFCVIRIVDLTPFFQRKIFRVT